MAFVDDLDLDDYQLSTNATIVDGAGTPLHSIDQLFENIYRRLGHEWLLTQIEQVIRPQNEWFVQVGEALHQISEIKISADHVARDYVIIIGAT